MSPIPNGREIPKTSSFDERTSSTMPLPVEQQQEEESTLQPEQVQEVGLNPEHEQQEELKLEEGQEEFGCEEEKAAVLVPVEEMREQQKHTLEEGEVEFPFEDEIVSEYAPVEEIQDQQEELNLEEIQEEFQFVDEMVSQYVPAEKFEDFEKLLHSSGILGEIGETADFTMDRSEESPYAPITATTPPRSPRPDYREAYMYQDASTESDELYGPITASPIKRSDPFAVSSSQRSGPHTYGPITGSPRSSPPFSLLKLRGTLQRAGPSGEPRGLQLMKQARAVYCGLGFDPEAGPSQQATGGGTGDQATSKQVAGGEMGERGAGGRPVMMDKATNTDILEEGEIIDEEAVEIELGHLI